METDPEDSEEYECKVSSGCHADSRLHETLHITYGPHKAVAELSNYNEPIGRKSGIQLVRKSMDFTFNCFELQLN